MLLSFAVGNALPVPAPAGLAHAAEHGGVTSVGASRVVVPPDNGYAAPWCNDAIQISSLQWIRGPMEINPTRQVYGASFKVVALDLNKWFPKSSPYGVMSVFIDDWDDTDYAGRWNVSRFGGGRSSTLNGYFGPIGQIRAASFRVMVVVEKGGKVKCKESFRINHPSGPGSA